MEVDGVDRLRGVLLAGAGVAVLLVGGWWWRAEAPAGAGAAVGPSAAGTYWQEDPVTGSWHREPGAGVAERPEAASSFLVDARTGAVIRPPVDDSGNLTFEPGGWQQRAREVEWSERARLRPGDALVRQGGLAAGESRVLRFSCTGPGELLIQVVGARAADPMTAGCDGAEATIEIIGIGASMQVSFSPAGAAPIEVRAELMPNG